MCAISSLTSTFAISSPDEFLLYLGYPICVVASVYICIVLQFDSMERSEMHMFLFHAVYIDGFVFQ